MKNDFDTFFVGFVSGLALFFVAGLYMTWGDREDDWCGDLREKSDLCYRLYEERNNHIEQLPERLGS